MTDKQFKQLNLEKEIFDVNNNLIYERTFRGYEYWYKYNEKRELIEIKTNSEIKQIQKTKNTKHIIIYNNINKVIKEEWYLFDDEKRLINFKSSLGIEIIKKYNNENILIYEKTADGKHKWYNEDGWLVKVKTSVETYYKYDTKYNKLGKKIVYPSGYICYFDKNNNKIDEDTYNLL